MAATKQLSIDVLLVTVERDIPYLELQLTYKTDGSDVKVKDYFDNVRDSLEAGRKDPIEGVEYQSTKAGDVGIIWLELEGGTQAQIQECFAWLGTLGTDWVRANPTWKKQKDSSRQGYLGFPLQKK